MTMNPPYHQFLFVFTSFLLVDRSQSFCPYLSSSRGEQSAAGQRRTLYDSLTYYDEDQGTCTNNCFMNDGGNLEAQHQAPDGSAVTTFDIMSYLSDNEYDGSDMCVFSMQELRIPNNEISDENLAELIYLGDSAGRRMHEFAQDNSDNVLLAACTVGRVGATAACSNAKKGVEGYDYYANVGDDDSLSEKKTYYKDRFCRSAILKSKIDHPHSITIFRLNSNDLEDAEALLEDFRENHATNMAWAYETQIGADGHMLAKVVPCDQISDRFKNPSNMYPNLADDNSVCDYVGSNGKQFAEEALMEWQNLCSVWPRNEDGSLPKCHRTTAASASTWTFSLTVAFVFAVGAAVYMHKQTKPKGVESNVDKSQLITELT